MINRDSTMLNIKSESVFSFKEILGEYSFRLKEIPDIEIKIRLYRYADSNDISFSTSHFILTPIQAGSYITSRNYAPTEEIALMMAINTITDFYYSAIREGHTPSVDWLEENTNY